MSDSSDGSEAMSVSPAGSDWQPFFRSGWDSLCRPHEIALSAPDLSTSPHAHYALFHSCPLALLPSCSLARLPTVLLTVRWDSLPLALGLGMPAAACGHQTGGAWAGGWRPGHLPVDARIERVAMPVIGRSGASVPCNVGYQDPGFRSHAGR